MNKKIVIVGATSSIATHCARLWLLSEPADMVLIGRDHDRLQRIAQDLQARSAQSHIDIKQLNLNDVNAINTTVEEISTQSKIDIVLIAHGSLSNQNICQSDLTICANELHVNAISPVIFAEAFARRFEENNHGTIAIIGSVAGDRGRKSNYVYGAAKGLITRYAQGLQHRLANTNVNVVLIKPGPTDTPMTALLKAQGANLAPVEDVAAAIVKAIKTGRKTVYVPRKWELIMMIIRHLPSFIFNKMNI